MVKANSYDLFTLLGTTQDLPSPGYLIEKQALNNDNVENTAMKSSNDLFLFAFSLFIFWCGVENSA